MRCAVLQRALPTAPRTPLGRTPPRGYHEPDPGLYHPRFLLRVQLSDLLRALLHILRAIYSELSPTRTSWLSPT
eukprot:1416274-Rhodomonas_salina.1